MTATGTRDDDRFALRQLAVIRIAFASLILARSTPLLAFAGVRRFADAVPLLGWPAAGWTLSIGPRLPWGIVASLCGVRTLAAIALLLGFHARVAAFVCGAAGFVVLAQDLFGSSNTLRLLYAVCFVLAAIDCDSEFASRPSRPRATRSSIALVRAFAISIYLWAALAKCNGAWWLGDTLDLFHQSHLLFGRLASALLETPERRAFAARATLLAELAVGAGLAFRPTRRFALVTAIALHIAFEIVARPDVFGFAMLVLLIAFVDVRSATSPATATMSGSNARGRVSIQSPPT